MASAVPGAPAGIACSFLRSDVRLHHVLCAELGCAQYHSCIEDCACVCLSRRHDGSPACLVTLQKSAWIACIDA